MRALSSAASAAGAICDHVRSWLSPSPFWRWRQPVVSMGVMSDGSYGVPPGIFFSFPLRCGDGFWKIEQVALGGSVGIHTAQCTYSQTISNCPPCLQQSFYKACYLYQSLLITRKMTLILHVQDAVQGLALDEYSRFRLQRSSLELLEEKQIALAMLGPA